MSKFSIFTIFLSATIVIIVAELMVNEYVKYPAGRKTLATNILQTETANPADAAAGTQQSQGDSPLSFALISGAGFKDVSLQRVPFNGILFESIDLRDFKSVPVVVSNLLKNNREVCATFFEFRAGSLMLSNEIYRMLKQKSGSILGAAINETNAFGAGSFFVNFTSKPGNAFLVVNTGDNVYALTYLKDLHPLVKNLLAEIVKVDSVSNK